MPTIRPKNKPVEQIHIAGVPASLKAALVREAKAARPPRSLNAHIVYILEEHVREMAILPEPD